MKKSILLIVLALFTTVSFAQVSWNAKVGMNVSNWTDEDDSDPKVGFKIGAGMEYAFTDMWSIQPSLFFSTKGAKNEDNGVKTSVNQMYLELPIMAAARIKAGESANVVISAGPYLAYGIGGKYKQTTKVDGVEIEGKVDTFGKNKLKRFDAGLGFGVAGEFNKIIVGLDCQFGLAKIIDVDGVDNKNMNFSISVGYKF